MKSHDTFVNKCRVSHSPRSTANNPKGGLRWRSEDFIQKSRQSGEMRDLHAETSLKILLSRDDF